jgi:hypothetical protein
MKKLKLCFLTPEQKESRPLTSYEINQVTMAAQGASAIIRVMTQYACDNPQGEEDDTLGVFCSVFNVLGLLMEPVTDYLFQYGGREAAPEPKTEQENEPETAKA